MELAIPVVVKFLSCHHKELSHNVSSYLSLAAIDNADRLAKYMDLIVNSILKGKLNTVNPCYNDSICSEKCYHYNEFAVLKNP